jgi:hypothetical protein
LLSVVTLATSWSGYQASRWGGLQALLYSQASALRVESTRDANAAGQLRTIDVVLFGNWLGAYAEGQEELAEFYAKRFRPEFIPAFDAWLASKPQANPAAAPSPFALPEYTLALEQKALQLDEEAAVTFVRGQEASQQSDNYVLNAVLLASVLFFGGIAQRFAVLPIRATIVALATVMCVIGLYNLATYPIW